MSIAPSSLAKPCSDPVEREDYDAAVDQMRLDPDGSAIDAAWADGRRMGPEAAVEFAVSAEPSAPPLEDDDGA